MTLPRRLAPIVGLCIAFGSARAQDAAVRIAADPRIELMAIVFRLSGGGFDQAHYVQYDSAVRRQFEPHRAHEAVALARELHEKRAVGFSTVMALAIAFEPFPSLGL
ncbi:MAG TPA: hypothetical protein VKA54_04205, partial [Gemmatimonadaceae bacterium]|nr:hypothetical protein [Gemmatimonadaceae bacterium]